MTSALMVLTGSTVWTMRDGTTHPTGFWAREFMEAHNVFTDGGLAVHIATPGGVPATVDQLSYKLGYNDDDTEFVTRQKRFITAMDDALGSPLKLEEVTPGQYDVLFIVGGAGFAGNVPWLFDDRPRLAGARFEAAPAWTEHVVVDGNLVTGQQNVSSGAADEMILQQLKVLSS